MAGALDRVVRVIDAVSTATGWLAGWLIVPMTVAAAYEVIARYAFHAPTKWTYEVTYMTYGAQFMLASAYTLLKGGHIRTDVFYERWSAKTRATIDAVCYLLFFFPGLLFILYAGAVEARVRLGHRRAHGAEDRERAVCRCTCSRPSSR